VTVKEIVASWLKAKGFDGLVNTEIPCGCLIGNLAPCGEMHETCKAGYRRDVKADEQCGCDGCGTDHWEIVELVPDALHEWMSTAHEWLCECGERCNPASADWRWCGYTWQHHHGYPIGHVDAVRCPEKGGGS
jgi:hypothetical protein